MNEISELDGYQELRIKGQGPRNKGFFFFFLVVDFDFFPSKFSIKSIFWRIWDKRVWSSFDDSTALVLWHD